MRGRGRASTSPRSVAVLSLHSRPCSPPQPTRARGVGVPRRPLGDARDAQGAHGGPPPILDGTVQTLSDADELLFDGTSGTLAETTTGTGTPGGSFASYPYGLSRWDDSDQTRKYANSPRDKSMNLDQMGARWYAFDLGVWTSVDPYRLERPSRGVTSAFAGDHAYAYAGLTPIVLADPDGRDPSSSWTQAAMGFAWGLIQGAVPGGFLADAAPLPKEAQTATFQMWHGGGQIIGGMATAVLGGGGEVVGTVLDGTGVGAVPGVALNVGSAVLIANGVTASAAGVIEISHAMSASAPPPEPAKAPNVGRGRSQQRLRQLGKDPNTSSADRGWIKQEENAVQRGNQPRMRNPPGKQLAHARGREAAKGYDHVDSPSSLQDTDLHRTQHKFDDQGRANKERP